MNRLFLKIYDFMSSHKAAAWTILAVTLALCAFSVSRMHYSEDISAFLPENELTGKYSSVYMKLGGQDRIAVLFRGADRDSIMCAMERFGEVFSDADTASLVSDLKVRVDDEDVEAVTDFIRNNMPCFLDRKDYERIDSLLSVPGYIQDRLEADKRMLMFPSSSLAGDYVGYDPLGLFSPVFSRLSALSGGHGTIDGFVFLGDSCEFGAVFVTSPFGNSESGNNALIVNLLKDVTESVSMEWPTVRISYVGGPVIAVENSSRIKKDSILAVIIAIVLIFIVLRLAFSDWRDILWIGFSILCGSLFALGLISLCKSEISLIILGIGSIIIGIAVNYPLHYIDHLKHCPDHGDALKEVVSPLLTGNITTVFAFLSLYLLKAKALHDFGLTGALVLVGTILFVLVFLPALSEGTRRMTGKTVNFGRIVPEKAPKKMFWPFVLVTCILGVFGMGTGFDTDMRNINYMTAGQKEDLAMLSSATSKPGYTRLWAVSEGDCLESALERNESLLSEIGAEWNISTISPFVPSARMQQDRLAMWEEFTGKYPLLAENVRLAASEAGFRDSAFDRFYSVLDAEYAVHDASWFAPLITTVGQANVIDSEDGAKIVNYIEVPSGEASVVKERIASEIGQGSFIFDSTDVSGNLAGLLSEDFNSIGYVCGFIVFFFLWLSFGRVELSILSFLPLAVGWIWIMGLMHIFGLQFNIVNIILATFIFGQGDDYTIFITEGLMHEYAYGRKILPSYRNSIALSAIIMFIGIGTLIIARHPAMKSLAQVTIIGMFTVVMMACWLPQAVFGVLVYKNGKRRAMPVTAKRLLRSIWAFMFFLCAVIVIVPATKIHFAVRGNDESSKLRYHRFLQKLSAFIMHRVPGVGFALDNSVRESFGKPAVIVSNHQSHLDVLCLMMLDPKIVILTNDWVWNNIFYRGIIRKAEFYPVSDGMDANLERLRDLVARGYSVVVFPEGTRSADCSIGRFHRGAFQIALSLGLDVLPVVLHGAGHVLPKEDFMLRPGRIDVKVCKRIPPQSMGADIMGITRGFRKYFIDEYSGMCSTIEKAGYFAELVRHSYIYKGKDIERAAAREIAEADLYRIDSCGSGSDVMLGSSPTGAYALLFALSRKDVKVFFEGEGTDAGELLRNCPLTPENLFLV